MKNKFLIFLIVLLPSCFGRKPIKTGQEGKDIPSFKLLLIDGKSFFDTNEIPKNKSVVLFYFGPGCPYSRAQMQEIVDKMEEMTKIQFIVFTTARFNEMKWFYNKYQLGKFRNVITGIDYKNVFVNYFHTNSVPYLAIYGNNQKLNEVFSGQMPAWQIKKVANY